jgi:pyruvate kinase
MTRRRTKIVASIGPACDQIGLLQQMVAAGMDVARLSLAHSSLDETIERLQRVRKVAAEADRFVGVLADLPGPKIRAAPFPEGGAPLAPGSTVDLVPGPPTAASSGRRIVVDHAHLLAELRDGDRVAIGDGAIQLVVEHVGPHRARATVAAGGVAQGRPGIALPAGRSVLNTPTPTDLRYLEALCQAGVDAVAISFVRSAADVVRARAALDGRRPMLVAKIETQEAVDHVDEIIDAADAVMVARGDLGIRCALEDVPHYQKRIIRAGVAYGRPVITATEMLESMVRSPRPTRAEVSDIANAVFDGTSALMLSGETAVGHDPVGAVRTMARVALRAEREFDYRAWGRNLGPVETGGAEGAPVPRRIAAAVSSAAWRASIDVDVRAIIACTSTGNTARAIARFRPAAPILAVTPSHETARQLALSWGVTPVLTEWHTTTDDIVWFAVKAAAELGHVEPGDVVAVLAGSPTDPQPTTDTLRLVRVG